MDSVQRLRLQARNLGNLQTTPEQVVIVEDRVIQIVPARPEIIYVPVYRPEIVFVRPPPPRGLFISFGPPLPIGPWFNHDLNWRNHEVIVWHPEHPRPHNWWYEPPSRHDRPRLGSQVRARSPGCCCADHPIWMIRSNCS